jgi:uncharacterized protein YlzI (FlbEa/FlbD family)
MRSLELTLEEGGPVTLNPAVIACFQPANGGTVIVFIGGGSVTVKESYNAVAELFNPERQAGG